MCIGKRFCKSTCESFDILSQNTHTMGQSRCRENSPENQYGADGDGGEGAIPNPRFLRSSSTGHSFARMERRNFTNYRLDQQRLQIRELHFDKFPTPQTFSCWKRRFKTEVCSCPKFQYEGCVMEQRSRDGYLSGRFKNFAIHFMSYSFS